MSDGKGIVKREEGNIVKEWGSELSPQDLPLSVSSAKDMMEHYQRLMDSLLVKWDERVIEGGQLKKDSDFQRFPVKIRDNTGKEVQVFQDRIKKSGVRKLGMAFKLSYETVSKERTERTDGTFVYRYEVKAIHPNGRYSVGVGKADSRAAMTRNREEHDTEATAYTRALNRAVLDLVAFGQVSAEEMEGEPHLSSTANLPHGIRKVEGVGTFVVSSGGDGSKPNAGLESTPLSSTPSPESGVDLPDTGGDNIKNYLESQGLDPNGVSVDRCDWGFYEIIPSTNVRGSESWRKYDDALKRLGAVYHKKGEPQYATNWTIQLKVESPVER